MIYLFYWLLMWNDMIIWEDDMVWWYEMMIWDDGVIRWYGSGHFRAKASVIRGKKFHGLGHAIPKIPNWKSYDFVKQFWLNLDILWLGMQYIEMYLPHFRATATAMAIHGRTWAKMAGAKMAWASLGYRSYICLFHIQLGAAPCFPKIPQAQTQAMTSWP